MSNPKVLLFGSFTEDETRSWQQKPSSGNDEKPREKKELQFGSLDFASEISSSDLNYDSKKQLVHANGAIDFEPTKALFEDGKVSTEDLENDHLPGLFETLKLNGNVDSCIHTSLIDGIGDRFDSNSLSPSQIESSEPNHSQSSKFHVLDGEKMEDSDHNGTMDGSRVPLAKGIRKETNGLDAAVRSLLPHGLINSGNLCFLNATLQALLSCTPFVELLQEIRAHNIPKVGYPTITAFADFISDFNVPSGLSLKKKDMAILETGRPFSPSMFEVVLKSFTPDVPNSMSGTPRFVFSPRQEDAQEFLSFLMDQMHDELLKLDGQSTGIWGSKSSVVSLAEDDEWETVGPKNKSAVTRTQSFIPTELSDIFGGQLRSVVTARGNKASATVQPYLLLHLDIYPEGVRTIEDALHLFSAPETLEGYRTSVTEKAGVVSARKSVKIQKLSKVMILHLKRFSYGSQGSTKLHKPVRFPLELMLGRELLVSPSTEGRKYELVATITHHGGEPSKGHYTTDARYPNGQWLRFDDASVSAVGTGKVLHDQAYVLFYKQV
ncbi:ubiquitin carboxyl-terminal hydrolase 24-like isoform X2 [Tripterygium wilfordii]|uniref:ubiquitin carboxyl-terminal hydrolase 24-like isoform X2 n=1 Tax=Tripterygium wilfordii TaxID=458696 RepID=UPI0018F7EDC6|nr:ubiquitin carboxyl-terminal hydrolase 24-like isoform X2 [Tripterygium wilfordii]